MRILVTGASGFVGGEAARQLRAAGHSVVGTVNSRRGHADDVALDVRDPDAFAALPEGRFDAVVHAAALMGPERFDRKTWAVNVHGTENALAFARTRGVTHFVQIGTIAAYGLRCVGIDRHEGTALSTSRFHPFETEYMRSKAEAERRIVASGLPYTILRLPVVIGAGSTFAAPAILPRLRAGVAPFLKRRDRAVSVLCIGNVGPMLDSVLALGPANRAYNACDHHLPWSELVDRYAQEMGVTLRWESRPYTDGLFRSGDPYHMFFLTNGLVGAHFPSDAIERERPFAHVQTLADAVRDEVHAASAPV